MSTGVALAVSLLTLCLIPAPGHALGRAWTATYDGGSHDRAGCRDLLCRSSVATDTQGNVYVTGATWNGASYDFLTVKYGANGVRQWVATYDGGDSDESHAIAVDGGGNVYVTGVSWLETQDYGLQPHFQTIKYSPSGVQQWAASYNYSVWGQGLALAVDAGGNVYVTGESYVENGEFIAVDLLRYSPAGALQWSRRILYGFDYEESSPRDLALDPGGNVYVAGSSYKPLAGDTDYLVAKYSPAGARIWVRAFDAGGMDAASDIAADASGNAYVTGTSHTVKYSAAGALQWAAFFPGAGHAILLSGGWVYTAGTSTSGTEFVVSGHHASGPAVGDWYNTYPDPGRTDRAYALGLAGTDLFLTGTSTDASGTDVLTVGFDPSNGQRIWSDRFDGGHNDAAYSMATAADGSFAIAGSSGNGTDDDLLAIRYTQTPGTSVRRLTFSPSPVVPGGCATSTGKVTLDGRAPAGGAVVHLTNDNPKANLPATVTVPEGATSQTFPLGTSAVSDARGGYVTATYGGVTRTEFLTVRPIGVASLVLSPNPVVGPGKVSASLLLECAAAPGGILVTLGTSNSAVARPDLRSLTIPAGSVSGRFTVSTADVAVPSWADIRATANGVAKRVRLAVEP